MGGERYTGYMDFHKRGKRIFTFPNDIACAAGLGQDRVPSAGRCALYATQQTVLQDGTCAGECAIVTRMKMIEANTDVSTA